MEPTSPKACIFCQIASSEGNDSLIYEDESFMAILDKRPLFLGHTLVTPKQHFQTLYDLPSELVGPLFQFAQRVGKAVEEAMQADGSFVAINNRVSQSVPHVHIHIVPRKEHDGLRGFFWPRQQYESEKQKLEICSKIRQRLS